MRKFVYSLAVLMAAGTLSLQAQENLMEGAIIGHDGNETPSAPWYAWNTSTASFGDGNGWQFRNEAGANAADPGNAKQMFFRWNWNNSPWVYAYKVELEAGFKYKLTCDATTNDGKENSLLIGYTTNIATVTDPQNLPNMESFDVSNYPSTVLWTDPLKVDYELSIAVGGEYYILFSYTNTGGNVITRAANFVLVNDGEADIDYQTLFTDLQTEVEAYFTTLMEEGFEGGDYDELNAIYEWLYYEGDDYKAAYIGLLEGYQAFQAAYPSYKEYDAVRTAITQYISTGKLELASEETMNALSSDMMVTPSTGEAAKAKVTSLTNAWRAAVESAAVAGGVEDAVAQTLSDFELTDIGTNHGQGPTFANGEVYSGDYYDKYNQSGCVATQTATLKKGTYRYAIFARGSVDIADYTLSVSGTSVEATEDGELSIEPTHIGNQGSVFGNGWDIDMIDFVVTEDDTEVIFTISADASGNQWLSFMQPSLVMISDKDSTAVAEIEAAAGEAAYYTIDGVKVNGKLLPGVYVKVAGGKASKVLIRK